ncbi:MAG: lysophospholipid acyltransferase family protein [Nocardioides sp.]
MPTMDLVYPPVIGAARLLFRALGLRIEVEGADRMPPAGPVVLASNHVSFLDFTLVGLAAQPRYVRFLTRHDVFANPFAGPFMRAMRHIPVDREAPAAAYLTARRMLREGEVVGIFPEAGISQAYDVRSLMPGAVALAAETGAPLVPLTIWGPQRIATSRRPTDLTRGRPVSISVGEPLHLARGADVRAETVALGRLLQGMLTELQTQERHRPAPGEDAPWHPRHLGGTAPTRIEAAPTESSPLSALRWYDEPQAGPVATSREPSAIQPLQEPG